MLRPVCFDIGLKPVKIAQIRHSVPDAGDARMKTVIAGILLFSALICRLKNILQSFSADSSTFVSVSLAGGMTEDADTLSRPPVSFLPKLSPPLSGPRFYPENSGGNPPESRKVPDILRGSDISEDGSRR